MNRQIAFAWRDVCSVAVSLSVSTATSFIFILYFRHLQFSLTDYILYIFFLSNNVLYMQISILETFLFFIFYTYVFVILSNVLLKAA
jgi:hypothetical protein